MQAIGWAVVLKLVVMLGISERFVISVCAAGISVNLMLMAFNLIPIPPLDGGRILRGLLPSSGRSLLDRIEPYGMVILVVLMAGGGLGSSLVPSSRRGRWLVELCCDGRCHGAQRLFRMFHEAFALGALLEAPAAPSGRALIGLRPGRHTALLALEGHRVLACDIDLTGVEALAELPNVTLECRDLEGEPWPWEAERFAGITTNYLQAALSVLLDSLMPVASSTAETFTEANMMIWEHPRNPDHYLTEGEPICLAPADESSPTRRTYPADTCVSRECPHEACDACGVLRRTADRRRGSYLRTDS